MESRFTVAVPFGESVRLTYTNYRGERRERHIRPISLWYGVSPWHVGPQWVVAAEDLEDGGRVKDFALGGFLNGED